MFIPVVGTDSFRPPAEKQADGRWTDTFGLLAVQTLGKPKELEKHPLSLVSIVAWASIPVSDDGLYCASKRAMSLRVFMNE